jgi:hypothetical protein
MSSVGKIQAVFVVVVVEVSPLIPFQHQIQYY